MPTTPDLAIPYPAGPDAADGPGALQALAEIVEQLLLERTPTGTVRASISETADAGWLVLDGTEKEKATFPELDALISALGYPWGSTATHFTLPDYRGRALYGKGTHADVNGLADTDGLALASRRPKHAHGDGTLAAASHSHGDGSLAAASHSHSDGTLAAESHSHGDGTLAAAVMDQEPVDFDAEGGATLGGASNVHTHDVTGATGSTAPDVTGATGSTAPDVTGATGSTGADVTGATAEDGPAYAVVGSWQIKT